LFLRERRAAASADRTERAALAVAIQNDDFGLTPV
jgi:hypothetical protein